MTRRSVVRAALAAAGLAIVAMASPALSGPVLVYREGPEFCPRDRPANAAALTEAQAIERARTLLPKTFCGPTLFVDGCDYEPEFALGIWRIYVHQYRLTGARKDRGGLEHSYLILDPVGNCVANIPGT
ncbi:MAG: hypothetical protein ABI886_01535 [Betaproteobacteria bacterium]